MDDTLPDEESALDSVLQDTDASSSLVMVVGGTVETAEARGMIMADRWM
jgi:uncharacterized alpha-E superfamily protein